MISYTTLNQSNNQPSQQDKAVTRSVIKGTDDNSTCCALGTNTKFSTPPLQSTPYRLNSRQSERYTLQSAARRLLPGERVCNCMRMIVPESETVAVKWSKSRQTASYGNLAVCGSIWTCPVCAARITEQRREELTIATNAKNLYPVMITLTLRHNRHDGLEDLRRDLAIAWGKFKAGMPWKRIRERYGWVGDVRSQEITYSDADGWHPHYHALVFFDHILSTDEIREFEEWCKLRWLDKLHKVGREGSYERACDVQPGNLYAAAYVSKFGREPANPDHKRPFGDDSAWTVAHELVKGSQKVGRSGDGDEHLTPFQLLYRYQQGDKRSGALFREYAKATKGASQLHWSKGFKAYLGIGEESDQELAQSVADDIETLIELTRSEWYSLLKLDNLERMRSGAGHHDLRGQLLQVAAAGDRLELLEWLEAAYDRLVELEAAADRDRIEQAQAAAAPILAARRQRSSWFGRDSVSSHRNANRWWERGQPPAPGWVPIDE